MTENNKLENYGDVLTVKELQNILPVGRNSIYKLLNEKRIKSITVGKKIIIPKNCLCDYLQSAN